MGEQERTLEKRPAGRRVFAAGALAAAAMAAGAAVWAYLEYAGAARTTLLGIALSAALGGAAFAVLLSFRFAFAFRTEEAPRDWPPTQPTGGPIGPQRRPATGRRAFLLALSATGATLLAFVLLPLRSLGTWPRRTLLAHAWHRGIRLVTLDGQPLRPGDLAPGGIVPAMPESAPDDVRSLLTVVRLARAPGEGGELAGLRAYSRICTHAGCAVAIFRATDSVLVCPCHRSAFDAARDGAVLEGPASQALPSLPLAVDPAGFLIADGGFNRAIGPLLGARHPRNSRRKGA